MPLPLELHNKSATNGGAKTKKKNKKRRATAAATDLHEAHVYNQEPFRASILVTEELEKAVERCKVQVEQISKECRRRNRRFRCVSNSFRIVTM